MRRFEEFGFAVLTCGIGAMFLAAAAAILKQWVFTP